MDILLIFLRVSITLTFLILAAGGPWALIQLSRFIKRYKAAHEVLKARVAALERQANIVVDKEGPQV